MYTYSFRADYLESDNQSGGWSLGKTNYLSFKSLELPLILCVGVGPCEIPFHQSISFGVVIVQGHLGSNVLELSWL